MSLTPRVYKIKGVVQHYSWGGFDFIPELLQQSNTEAKPFAEYWLGAHHKSPSELVDKNVPLNKFIQQHPEDILGVDNDEQAELSFLFKILDVRQMLSIQVHPDKASAEKGFEEEEEKGIPVDAPHRNYRDKNHKPELMVALSDFWLLHGFKCEDDLVATFDSVPELSFLKAVFYESGLKGMFELVMSMPQEKVDEILTPLMRRILPLYKSDELQRADEHFWAARAASIFCNNDCYDRGIFSIYFLNLLHLKEGEGIYQPPGMLHAYLEGQNAEVMANSDNVLRAGLTDKHVNVPELMKHVQFIGTTPAVLKTKDENNHTYETPAKEFALQHLQLVETYGYQCMSPEIIFVIRGDVSVYTDGEQLNLGRGDALFALPATTVALQPQSPAEVFRVFRP